MNAIIICASTHHGNTRKVADAIAKERTRVLQRPHKRIKKPGESKRFPFLLPLIIHGILIK